MKSEELEALIKKAGVGERTAKKLRQANQPTATAPTATPKRPRGHGAARDNRQPVVI